jgi:ABC-type Fe3+ transport system substrate-binding protein
VTRHAANPDAARRLLEWLVSVPANSRYARESQRLPVAAGAATRVPGGDPFGDRPPVPTLAGLGFLLEDASRLAERARYP